MENNSSSSGISPPKAAVTQNLAHVNSTSLHFLNATRPTWMTGKPQNPTASTPPTTTRRLPQDNHAHPGITASTTTTLPSTAPPHDNDAYSGIPLPTASTTTTSPTVAILENNHAHPEISPPTASTTPTATTPAQNNYVYPSQLIASTDPANTSMITTLAQNNHAYPSQILPQLVPPPTATIPPLTTHATPTLTQSNQAHASQTPPQPAPRPSPLTTHATSSPISPVYPLRFSSNQPSPMVAQPPSVVGPAPSAASVAVPSKRMAEAPNDDPNKRPRLPTDAAHHVSSPSLTTQSTNQTTYTERLYATVEAARQQVPSKRLNAIESQRVALLSQASKDRDLFFLLLHQLFCLAFVHPPSVTRLGFGQAEKAGLATLDPILGSNSLISLPVLSCFVNFPRRADSLEKTAHVQSVDQVKNYLVSLGFKWDGLRRVCLTRRYPPSWGELVYHFPISSIPTLATLYVSLDRHISPHRHANWESQSLHLFRRSRDSYELLRNQPGFRLDQYLNTAIRAFGGEYQNMIATFTSPASSAQTHPVAPGPVPPHHAYTGVSMNPTPPPQPAIITPMQHAQLPQQVASGASSSRPTSRRGVHSSSSSPSTGPPLLSTANPGMQPRILTTPRQPLPSSPAGPPNQTNVAMCLNGHLPFTYDPLLPPPNFQMAQASHPNPDVVALHQLQLRSPPFAMDVDVRGKAAPVRLYAYMSEFALSPQRVSLTDNFFVWNFDLSAELLAHRPGRLPPSGVSDVPGARVHKPGCILLRLNCIKQNAGAPAPEPGAYAETPTSWPAFVFVSLNEFEDVEVRRKAHWGRDRATDITDLVSPGRNTLSLSYHQQQAEESYAFFLAVEVFRVGDEGSVRDLVKTIDEATAVAAITAPLKKSYLDDEISCADVGLSIDLIDPFMAKIWTTPVRGSRCKHRECFDLDAFLISRASSEEKNYRRLNDPDRWNCPICGRDARPQELAIDGFLVKVRATLEADGNLDARAISAFLDGSWIPRTRANGQQQQQQQQQQQNGATMVKTNVESAAPSPAAVLALAPG